MLYPGLKARVHGRQIFSRPVRAEQNKPTAKPFLAQQGRDDALASSAPHSAAQPGASFAHWACILSARYYYAGGDAAALYGINTSVTVYAGHR